MTRDHLGSIREVTDDAGAVVTRNDYDPYGRVTRVAGTEDSRFGYTGHMVHGPSGLALARYRVYDPTLGRWLSEDPAGAIDGPNLYGYVTNRPTRFSDPEGLSIGTVVGALAGAPLGPAGMAVGATLGTLAMLAALEALNNAMENRSRKEAEDEAIRERKFQEDLQEKKDGQKKDHPQEKRPEDTAEDLHKTRDGFRKGGRDQVDSTKRTDEKIKHRPNDPARKCP